MSNKITKNSSIDADASTNASKKRLTTRRKNTKLKTISADSKSILDNELTENDLIINNSESTEISKCILVTDKVLSYPDKESYSFSFQLFVVALCLFFYILGVATSSLYLY